MRSIKITQVRCRFHNLFVFSRVSFVLQGVISLQEFTDVCSFLGNHGVTKLDEKQIHDLAASIDLDKNGVIDFNEFLEAFRMVDIENPNRDQ